MGVIKMTKALNEYLQEAEQKKARVDDLKQSIKQNRDTLTRSRQEYKKSVAEDKNNIDDLFHEIEALENKIRADKHKLQTLETVTEEHLKDNALKVMEGYRSDVVNAYQSKADKVNTQIQQAKSDYAKQVKKLSDEIVQINQEYNSEIVRYAEVAEDNNLSKNELNRINSRLHLTLDDALHGVRGHVKTVDTDIQPIEIQELQKGAN